MDQKVLTFLVALLVLAASAHAGSFKASPVKLFLDTETKTTVLKITNQGEERVAVQLDAKRWQQPEGEKDSYTDTGDIIVFPKIATIEKDEEKIIRIGFSGNQAQQEMAYRLFVQELPVSRPGEMALKLALTLSIPIFIKPQKEISEWAIEDVGLAEEALRIKVKNKGNTHVLISNLKAVGLDHAGVEVFSHDMTGWYILPGSVGLYFLSIPREECLSADAFKVEAQVDRITREAALTLEKEMCAPRPPKAQDVVKESGRNK